MVDFCCDMDIYDTNMESIQNINYSDSLLRYYVIISLRIFTIHSISRNYAYIR